MKRVTTILAGALGIQLALATVLSFTGSNHAAFKGHEPLLAFDASKVDQIDIDESGAAAVTLAKRDSGWVLPSMSDFPVEARKVDGMFRTLADLKKGWPVATTADAAQRFKVSESAHERRIVLKSGGKLLGEVFFGASPAFRRVHARIAGDAKVYNVAFANYDAPNRAGDWMNRDLMNVPLDKIASISIGDLTLERKDGKFALPGLADGEQLKEIEANRFAGAVARPFFDSVAGKGSEALARVNEPDTVVTIKRADGGMVVYKYKKDADGAYLFASSAHDYLFKVAGTSIDPILKAKRENLVETKKKDGEGAQTSTKDNQEPGANGG